MHAVDRVGQLNVLIRPERNGVEGAVRQHSRARCGQVLDQPLLLHELRTQHRAARAGEPRVVVVPVDGRGGTAFEQRVRARAQKRADRGGVRPMAAAHEQDALRVALGERSLPCGHLDDRRAAAGVPGRDDRQGHAQREHERERRQDGRDGAASTRRERPKRARSRAHYCTTTSACMPPRK